MREQLIQLGTRLRELRRARGKTLQELAEATGLTAGLISKIENFRTIPSLPVLMAVAETLETDLAELFAGIDFRRSGKWLLVRGGELPPVEREERPGVRYRAVLERSLNVETLQVMHVTVDPLLEGEPVSSEGDEMIHMLAGEIVYRVGDEPVALAAGDTLFFDGRVPHAPSNRSGQPATLLVCYFLREEKGES